jgi:hypothetical protein
MPTNRIAETRHLAWELMDDGSAEGFEQALELAYGLVPELASVADDWDAHAAPEPEPSAPEPLYVPSALDPHEQRAMDKAIFERARGIRPQVVGRFAFVPSRTTGGTVYRTALDGSSCNCEAGEHGRICWHRFAVILEKELAA